MTTYFPIMKSRRGEYTALASLDRATRSRCVPIIELQPPQSPRQMPGKPPGPPKSIDQQVTDHLTSITQASSDNHRMVIDFAGLPEEKTSEGSHPANLLMRQLHLRGVQAQPVIWLKSSLLLMKALKGEPSAKHGITLRLTATDVDFGEETLQVVLSYVGAEPSVVDLLLDFRGMEDAGALRIGMMTAAVTSLAKQRWRSVSVAGTSFPEALTQYGEGQFRFPRHEWAAWLAVQGVVGGLDYSDYGVRNVPPPPGGAGTTPIPNLRYTLEDEWLVHRAKATDGSLYEMISADLVSSADWMGADHCAGCGGIAACSTGRNGRTAEQSIRFGMVHHLTVVGQQLANLGAGASFA